MSNEESNHNPKTQNQKCVPKKVPPKHRRRKRDRLGYFVEIVNSAIAIVGVLGFTSFLFIFQNSALYIVFVSSLFVILIELSFCLHWYKNSEPVFNKILFTFLSLSVMTILIFTFILYPLLKQQKQFNLPEPNLPPKEPTTEVDIPDIEIMVAEPLNPLDPMEYPFIIKNTGKTRILQLNINERHTIKDRLGGTVNMDFKSLKLQTNVLQPNEETTFVLGHTAQYLGANFVVNITVEFIITYTTTSNKLIERHRKIVGVRTGEGEYNWYPKSMAEE